MEKQVQEPIASYGRLYTYADYLKWKVDEKIEILKGKIYKMSPAPSTQHQFTSSELHFIIRKFLGLQTCKVFSAPFDVRLMDKRKNSAKDEDIITVFQPDLCVICDARKLDDRGCIGAPDLIIEILSPSNSKKEMKEKYELYEENGVREYWIVDYLYKTIHIYTLEEGRYIGLKPLIEEEVLQSRLFPELSFLVGDVFEASK